MREHLQPLRRTNELAKRLGVYAVVVRPTARSTIHFLHIGKNAGTQIKSLSQQVSAASECGKIFTHRHGVHLQHLPEQARYFFSIRNPVDRFVSGFYSRKRKGLPRVTNSDWTRDEAVALSHYDHAADLAEDLFSDDWQRSSRAVAAMSSIGHVNTNQISWFASRGNFLQTSPPVWVIRQEHLVDDFRTFLERADLGVDLDVLEFRSDPTTTHANDYSAVPAVSERGRANLLRWYAQDVAFYEMCEEWMRRQLDR